MEVLYGSEVFSVGSFENGWICPKSIYFELCNEFPEIIDHLVGIVLVMKDKY